MTNRNNNIGFTIVELLVVIVVIGVLAGLSIVSYVGVSRNASIALLQSDLKNAATELEVFRISSNNESYPALESELNGGSGFVKSDGTSYTYINTGSGYCLYATYSGISYQISSDDNIPEEGNCVLPTIASGVMAIGGTGGDTNMSIAQSSDSGYVLAGFTNSYGAGGNDTLLSKYTAEGSLSWTKTIGGASEDIAYHIVKTDDGGYAVTGYTSSYGAGGTDAFLAKFTSDGILSWSKTWGGASNDAGYELISTNDGGYAITGYTSSYGAGGTDAFLAKFTSDGTLSWNKTWGGTGSDNGSSLTQNNDGDFVIVGTTFSYGAGGGDGFLAKYASDGTLLWGKTVGGSAGEDSADSVVYTSDDGYAITGYLRNIGAGGWDSFLSKYASDGTLSWTKTWGGSSNDYGRSMVQLSDDSYAVIGYTVSYGAAGSNVFLAKYTSNGTLSWSKTWGSAGYDNASTIIISNDGGYALAGSTPNYGAGADDAILIKYQVDGTITGCGGGMCINASASVSTPSPSVSTPSPTVTTPSASVSSWTPTVSSWTPTSTVIVAPTM